MNTQEQVETRRPVAEVMTEERGEQLADELFGGALVVVDDADRWLAWKTATEMWLLNLECDATRRTYRISVEQFFAWSAIAPWNVGTALVQQWRAYLLREGKVVRRDPSTGGEAPWELDPGLRGQYVHWTTDDGRIIERNPERRDEAGRLVRATVVERGPLADATVNNKLAALSSLYRFAQGYSTVTPSGEIHYLWPLDRQNPFRVVKRLEVSPHGRATFPTTDELKRILGCINTDCLTGKRDYALLYTYVVTCKRFSEIVNIQWGDVWELADGNYGFKFKYKGEKGKTRKGVLPRKCFQMICEYLIADGRPPEEMKDKDYIFIPLHPGRGARLRGGEPVDPNHPICNGVANRIFKKYARRAGVDEDRCHIHALRHAGARQRVERMEVETGSVDYGKLQELLGHANIATTIIYSKTTLEEPKDPGGTAAAEDWLVARKRRRKKEPVAVEQGRLF